MTNTETENEEMSLRKRLYGAVGFGGVLFVAYMICDIVYIVYGWYQSGIWEVERIQWFRNIFKSIIAILGWFLFYSRWSEIYSDKRKPSSIISKKRKTEKI
jgi:hypothetical protein